MDKKGFSAKVAIIVLNYNNYQDTLNCVDSLKQMDYPNKNIIVVENGSRDGSNTHLSKIKGISYIRNTKNLGYAGGNNIGIKYAKELDPDYILILNNDTVVGKDFLTNLIQIASKLARMGVCGCKILDRKDNIWYGGGKLSEILGTIKVINDYRYKQITEVSFITGCMFLVRSEIIDRIGLFDERYFMYFEDAQFCYRVREHGYKLFYIPTITISHLVKDGKNNEIAAYFTLRNRQIFIKENLNNALIPRIYFYSLNYSKILYYWLLRNKLYKIILKAIKDFRLGKTGNSYNENIYR